MKINKNTAYQITAFILVVLIAGFFIIRTNRNQPAKEESQQEEQKIQASPSAPSINGESQNILQGTLNISDNLKKGNLMLVSENHTYYIYTNRDFSELLDKQVNVSYEGTLDNFNLDDITLK
jgi:hypothetical protein